MQQAGRRGEGRFRLRDWTRHQLRRHLLVEPDLRADIGAALEGRRGEFIIQGHLCTVWENDQYLARAIRRRSADSFERQLRQLRTDYLDVGMIHYVDAEADLRTVFDGPIIRLAQRLKAEGASARSV